MASRGPGRGGGQPRGGGGQERGGQRGGRGGGGGPRGGGQGDGGSRGGRGGGQGDGGSRGGRGGGQSGQNVTEQMAGLSLQHVTTGQQAGTEIKKGKFDYASRKPAGKAGRQIEVLSNHFVMKFNLKQGETLTAYHYDLTILKIRRRRETDVYEAGVAVGGDQPAQVGEEEQREIVSKALKHKVFTQMVNSHPIGQARPAFDGEKNFYTLSRVNPEAGRLEVILNEEGRDNKFVCVYKYVNHFMNIANNAPISQDAIQAIDIILGYGSVRKMVPMRANVFYPSNIDKNRIQFEGPTRDLGSNLQMAFGWYKSAKRVQDGFMINLDRAVTIFEKAGNLVEIVEQLYGKNSAARFVNDQYHCGPVLDEIKGLKVEVRFPPQCKIPFNRTYIVDDLSDIPGKCFFQWNETLDGREINKKASVEEYYLQKYKLKLKYTNLPCVKSKDRNLPFELCWLVPDQMLKKRLAENLKAQVTRLSCQKPWDRLKHITDSVTAMQQNSKDYINCSISLQPHRSVARVIEPPKLLYKNNIQVDPRKENEQQCSWRLDRKNFYEPADMTKWFIVEVIEPRGRYPIPQEYLMRDFARALMQKGQDLGMTMAQPRGGMVLNYDDRQGANSVFNCFRQIMKDNPDLQMIVVIIPQYAGVYNDVKYVGNTRGIATQCILKKHYNPKNPKFNKIVERNYLENLMQKINGKLGGINMVLAAESKPAFLRQCCMIIGLDVSHPAPGDKVPQSIAACVASYTPTYTKYFSAVKIQEKDREEIVDLKDVIVVLLKEFLNRNKRYPSYVIVYRDGVSRGQFDHVMACEVTAIKDAIRIVGQECTPKLTFLTVQKRHHVRFFQEEKDRQGRTNINNISPGTIVDTGVVDPTIFDFYLCSHYALQGTARPAHYANLYDECCLTSDELQQISYYLCYICVRCPKPISIPVPVKYAHLAAEKAKAHLESLFRARREGDMTSAGISAHANLAPKLYYV